MTVSLAITIIINYILLLWHEICNAYNVIPKCEFSQPSSEDVHKFQIP